LGLAEFDLRVAAFWIGFLWIIFVDAGVDGDGGIGERGIE
jgi:hypothetical protein